MALPEGGFVSGTAGVTAPGGAYTYTAGSALARYYAGSFYIDTGYNDPTTWASNTDPAELYGCRVYATGTNVNNAPASGTLQCRWQISAIPMWDTKAWQGTSSDLNQARILLMCRVYMRTPFSTANLQRFRLTNVNWALYRL